MLEQHLLFAEVMIQIHKSLSTQSTKQLVLLEKRLIGVSLLITEPVWMQILSSWFVIWKLEQ